MCRQRFSIISIVFLSLFSVAIVAAQGTCAPIIEEALRTVDDNCDGLDRNTVCYGYDQVQASFSRIVPEHFFSQPADVAPLLELEIVTTSALNEEEGTWGVALLNVQANLPNTLPGQNVTFILLGDTAIENAVSAEEAFIAANALEVATALESNVRSGPGLDFAILDRIPAGTVFPADGLSPDGEWLRVVFDERIAWMAREVFRPDTAMDQLPSLTPELRSPMQAFYLRTGIGESNCEAAPNDMLLVQGPENIEIDMTINGSNVRIGSTVAVRLLAENVMEFVVLDGHLEVLDENYEPTGFVIVAGQRSTTCLSDPDNLGLDEEANDRIVACEFSPPEWISSSEFVGEWCILQDVPSNLLNYPIDLTCSGELLPTPIPPTPIPRPADTQPTTGDPSQVTGVDCSSFAMIGPFEGITPRPTIFSWTAVPGATDYEIVFYDYLGNQAQSFFTKETSIELNVGQIPTGSELSWEARAYLNGAYACTTGRTAPIFRLADPLAPSPTPVVVSPTFTATRTCLSPDVASVTWANAPGVVTINWTDSLTSLGPLTFATTSGSTSISSSNSVYNLTSITVTSGASTITLAGC